jgi:hypothetical protein
MPDNAKAVEKLSLADAIRQVNELMIDKPQVLSIKLVKEGGRHTYQWDEIDEKAKKIRSKIREVLKKAWQANALNYEQIAERLRVDVLAIQCLIDDDFIFNYPHLI